MADSKLGKFFVFYLLLFLFDSNYRVSMASEISDLNPETHDPRDENMHKLEELVRNLGELVVRLESRLPKGNHLDHKLCQEIAQSDHDSAIPEQIPTSISDNIDVKERVLPVSVTKYSPFWTERFHFMSAVRLNSDPTCINVLPFRDYEGFSKYTLIGNEKGRVYAFLRNGDLALDFDTLLDSPITSILSYMSFHKNETVVVTGHESGVILKHRMWELFNGEDWSGLEMENVGRFGALEKDDFAINILEVHPVGRARYILSTDVSGRIVVFKENGMVYGTAVPSKRPLTFLKQRLLFLTEDGAGSLDLRSMKIKESECEGLNRSIVKSYAFDVTERSKAYGYTSNGDLVHVVLLGDVMNFQCRVRSMRKLDMLEPLVFHAIKGYLLVINQEKVSIYNVSSHHYARAGMPRLLFSANLDEIRFSFLNYQVANEKDILRRNVMPLVAGDREKLVVLSLGDGYVGMYRSNLPIHKGESGTILWTSPVLLFIVFLFGVWHFFAKKKEALISWGPDDPFGSPSSTMNSSFENSTSRNTDIMEMRGGLGGPSRYPRPGTEDHNPRLTSVNPNFRVPSEIKFRGSNIEGAGFQARREGLFASNQVVDNDN